MQTNDKFELVLKEKSEILLNCQKEKNFKSCSECDKILDCEIRKKYVNAVYESMSKGDTGGFDF